MDTYVEDKDALFREVFSHFNQVSEQPSTSLNEDIFRRASRALDASTPQDLLWRLLRTGETLLQTLQQDPRHLTRLLERVVLLIPFDELKTSISSDKLEEGLNSPSVPVKLLCLAYLAKAADKPSGASFIAASSSLVQVLVTLWLSVESTEVAERGLECLVALLAVDSPDNTTIVTADNSIGEATGHGLMWRRLFYDPHVYRRFFLWTSLAKSNYDLTTKKGQQQVTISQARLFDFLARTSVLDWASISTSTLPEVEKDFTKTDTADQPYGGLLRYASSDMINSQDFLMEVLRQDFFMKLLTVAQEENSRHVSPRLLQAIQDGAGVDASRQESAGVHL